MKEKLSLQSRQMPRLTNWILLLCALSVVLASCGKSQGDGKRDRPPVPVEVAQAIEKDAPLFIDAIGNVMAYNTVDVKSRVTGELIKTFFKEGDYLTTGQQLFTVDPAPFQSKVKEAEARLRQSKVLYEQAKRDYLRFKSLHSEKAVSQEQLETKEVDMNSKLHQTELHQAELESAKLNLDYCFIQSPLDGGAGERYIDNFNIVNANQDTLVTIKQMRPIKVKFSVPGKFLDDLRKHSSSEPLEVEAINVGNDKPETGALTMIDNTINPKTGMIVLEGTFPNPESKLWPGQFVQLRLKLTVTRNAVLAPIRSVSDGPEGQYVWVVGQDQTVAIRPVKISRRSEDMQVVSEGLKAGETVITDGQLTLYPGAKIITRAQMEQMKSKTPPENGQPSGGKRNEKSGTEKP